MSKENRTCHICGDTRKYDDEAYPLRCAVCGADLLREHAETLLLHSRANYNEGGAIYEGGLAYLTSKRLLILRIPDNFSAGGVTAVEGGGPKLEYDLALADVTGVEEKRSGVNRVLEVRDKNGDSVRMNIGVLSLRRDEKYAGWKEAIETEARKQPGSAFGQKAAGGKKAAGSKTAERLLLVQAGTIFLTLIAMLLLWNVNPAGAATTAPLRDYLASQRTAIALLAVAHASIGIALLAANILCMRGASKAARAGNLQASKLRYARVVFLFALALSLLPFGFAYSGAAKRLPPVNQDIAQIDAGTLGEAVVYIYKPKQAYGPGEIRSLTVLPVDAYDRNTPRQMLILDSLGFDPAPSALLDGNYHIEWNLENGMKAYRVVYTGSGNYIAAIAEAD